MISLAFYGFYSLPVGGRRQQATLFSNLDTSSSGVFKGEMRPTVLAV
ncbi:MAG: hypothetical protein ACI9WS_003014 [Paraglaciecola psychrophila]|jgi:hypothetical protein